MKKRLSWSNVYCKLLRFELRLCVVTHPSANHALCYLEMLLITNMGESCHKAEIVKVLDCRLCPEGLFYMMKVRSAIDYQYRVLI